MISKKLQSQKIMSQRGGASEFVYRSPYAQSVSIAGSFNNWSTNASKLVKDPAGNWRTSLRLVPGRYEYRFYVDGKWADDPNAKVTVVNSFGGRNAVIEIA